ncbi:ORF6N domain-containing protein [Pedobacter frigoris]|uniref:ORF6N domain-containing protein n=1 Tax=Pedobacter frigoris TaxID=2571272 RepID=UPI0029305345|nr:ORF6N domain-containing protein [Pedobacter frigoris]
MTEKIVGIPDEAVLSKIFQIRSEKVMLDRDLAELYGVETRAFNQAAKRNLDRFPEKFMFQLTPEEVEDIVSQNVIPSKQILGGAFPRVFTEHGVLMLSNVLKSKSAIKMSIRNIEMFVLLREMVLLHKDVWVLVEQVEKRLMKQDQKIEVLFSYLNKVYG